MLKIFIGYDKREVHAFHALTQSLLENAKTPIAIIPLKKEQLKDVCDLTDAGATTEFTRSRFLVPYLSNYEGISVFMDCDMICETDINDVIDFVKDKAVYVCQHDYVSKVEVKATGVNTNYPRKNWSSFIVFNNSLCKALTPEYVGTTNIGNLHRFNWLSDDDIGSLPLEYNWLVGEYEKNPDAKILHFTLGVPYFDDYLDCDNSENWFYYYGFCF